MAFRGGADNARAALTTALELDQSLMSAEVAVAVAVAAAVAAAAVGQVPLFPTLLTQRQC